MLWIKRIRVVLHLLRGAVTCALLFRWLNQAQKDRLIRQWSLHLLKLFDMRLELDAQAPLQTGGVVLVCNHVSWIDIFAINAWQPARFVSKAEVRDWPLIGWLCKQTGTVFLQRERRADARRTMHQITDMLQSGQIIAIFPEGTTTDGTMLLPFHANLLQASTATGKPIQPLCLRYGDAASGAHSTIPAYVGDTSLMASIDAMLRAAPMTVRLGVGTPLQPEGEAHRRALAQQGQEAVLAMLQRYDASVTLGSRIGTALSNPTHDREAAVPSFDAEERAVPAGERSGSLRDVRH